MIEKRTRDRWIGDLHRLAVEILPYLRLVGLTGDTTFFQHIISREAVALTEFESLVLAQGHEADTSLERDLSGYEGEVHLMGDCLAPRTAEEAVLEGFRIGSQI